MPIRRSLKRKIIRRKTTTTTTTKPTTTRKVSRRTGQRMSGPFRNYIAHDPFKPTYWCRLHYTQTLGLATGTANTYGTEQIFRLNSLYDPDFTGTGHQPYGFDQLAGLYNKYKVAGCKVQIILNNPDNDGCLFAAQAQPPGGTFTLAGKSPDVVKEQPMSVTRLINDSGSQTKVIIQYFPMSKLSGVTDLQYKADVDIFSAAVTANPAATPFLRMALCNLSGTASTLQVRVSLTYFCQFYDRIVQSQS